MYVGLGQMKKGIPDVQEFAEESIEEEFGTRHPATTRWWLIGGATTIAAVALALWLGRRSRRVG